MLIYRFPLRKLVGLIKSTFRMQDHLQIQENNNNNNKTQF